jgi:hypothetical protein
MTARTLPLRVEPLPGEAIDSWLECVARRSNVTWGELRAALGGVLPAGPNPDRWIGNLTREQLRTISFASGLDRAALQSMTLMGYPSAAVGFNPITARSAATYPWRHIRASRFCPQCLGSNGGRWKLSWRMVWFFACPEHACLLAHNCPECGAAQRVRPVVNAVPQPGRCTASVSRSRSSNPQRCCAELSEAPATSLEIGGPILALQEAVAELIINGGAAFGIYTKFPTSVAQVLQDLRVLGDRVLAACGKARLARCLSNDLLESYFSQTEPTRTTGGRMPPRAVPSVVTAAGITAAMAVVGESDLESAAEALRAMWSEGSLSTLAQSIDISGKRRQLETSAALRGVYLHALIPTLGVTDQLRYRCGSNLPARPIRNMDLVRRTAASIPHMLWPQWALHLAEPSGHLRFFRAALSVGLLVVGNDITTDQAIARLKCSIKTATVVTILRSAYESSDWPHLREALYRLADYLRAHGSPIDYQRRRELDVGQILPEATWSRICSETKTRPEGLEAVRLFLVERLSAVPPASGNPRLTAAASRISIRMTPELNDALMRYALEFLAGQGITGEPPQWCPPFDVLAGLGRTSKYTESVDVANLHKTVNMIRRRHIKLCAAIDALGLPIEVFRQACEDHPTPREPRRRPTRVVTTNGPSPAYQRARALITPERMTQLYLTEGQSLKAISSMFGTSSYTVTRLARDYGVPITKMRRTSRSIDADWLREEYINKDRTLKDLSETLGVAPATVRRLIESHDIPLKWFSHRPAGLPPDHTNVPELLLPALATRGGWQRLQRLAQAAAYGSFAEAQRALNIFGPALALQLSRIERDLGGPVVIRATRQKPMQLTPLGERVIAALKQCECDGVP